MTGKQVVHAAEAVLRLHSPNLYSKSRVKFGSASIVLEQKLYNDGAPRKEIEKARWLKTRRSIEVTDPLDLQVERRLFQTKPCASGKVVSIMVLVVDLSANPRDLFPVNNVMGSTDSTPRLQFATQQDELSMLFEEMNGHALLSAVHYSTALEQMRVALAAVRSVTFAQTQISYPVFDPRGDDMVDSGTDEYQL